VRKVGDRILFFATYSPSRDSLAKLRTRRDREKYRTDWVERASQGGEGDREGGRRYVELGLDAFRAVMRRPGGVLSCVRGLGDEDGRSGEDRGLERVDMGGTATAKVVQLLSS
jgi:hypothetical protein